MYVSFYVSLSKKTNVFYESYVKKYKLTLFYVRPNKKIQAEKERKK